MTTELGTDQLSGRRRQYPAFVMLVMAFIVLRPSLASAHVKWFADFDFSDPPRTFADILTPMFITLGIVTVIVLAVLVIVDRQLEEVRSYRAVNEWLTSQEDHSLLVMRIAMAASLIISWENKALIAPELAEGSSWVGWLQFVIALLLLRPQTTRIAGAGIVLLWLIAAVQYGAFHLVDYVHFIGIGAYLYFSGDSKKSVSGLGLPLLYATVGFALMWAGFEKLIYRDWGLFILAENPKLLLGLDPDLFLTGSAFVEISLGFLLIIGLLERPLAAVITLVFFTTTLLFGRVEVVGHTPLHAALVVFLFSGPGAIYTPPIKLHSKPAWRAAFAGVNFVVALVVVGLLYAAGAQSQYRDALGDQDAPTSPITEVVD